MIILSIRNLSRVSVLMSHDISLMILTTAKGRHTASMTKPSIHRNLHWIFV